MRKIDLSLYAIVDLDYLSSIKKDPFKACLSVVKGGATAVQLRSKYACDMEYYRAAQAMKKICAKFRVPFIINDRVDIAVSVASDGLHIGWNDMPPEKARVLAGENMIIGFSASNKQEALRASRLNVDYIGLGPVFPTAIKHTKPLGTRAAAQILKKISMPVVAIGGINGYNIKVLKDIGVRNFAMISAILSAENIEACTRAIKKIIQSKDNGKRRETPK
ncbi:MAG: thiamine phosphate synthase [Spirochaetia bacterium]|nr:thiamine phosphate synthase [Spirochaetia bacterium]